MLVKRARDSSSSTESLFERHSESEGSNSVMTTDDLGSEGMDSRDQSDNRAFGVLGISYEILLQFLTLFMVKHPTI